MSAATEKIAPAGKAAVLYDGLCPLCQRSVKNLKRLDWLGRLSYADARQPDQWPAAEVEIDPDRALDEMYLITPDGRHARAGFYAFRWIAGRLPLLWPLYPLMHLPGVPWVGRRLYRLVARNRFRLFPRPDCSTGQCGVPLRK